MVKSFKLSDSFVEKYVKILPPFGFNGLGELVYMRTYSRIKEDGTNEQWWETCRRVVEGTYSMQKEHIEQYSLGWNPWKAQASAQEMYDRMFHMKFLPPGRGLWAMGAGIINSRGLYAALNNCAFVSTANIKEDLSKPFCFLMDMSMLGAGVGFDTKGAKEIIIKAPSRTRTVETFVIPDSREGWVESVRMLLESYFMGTAPLQFDYSLIRPAGEPIRGFGGVASGPQPLIELHNNIVAAFEKNAGEPISITTIVDVMNFIGNCVVAGNVRRSSEIVFGEPKSSEYLDLKNYAVNPERAAYGWASNNSIFAGIGMDYAPICERIKSNGEPGLAWLENMQQFSRMKNIIDNKDFRATGANPCSEQTLESFEMCCLVETFPNKHESFADFQKTLKYAYLYAKTVTLGKTHWPETNRVLLRNRRIGCSVSGIAQFITSHGLETLRSWLEAGYDTIQEYDKEYSDWLAIPRSIKTTSVKPSGSVSLVAGATPGVHYPESRYYIRRMRLATNSKLIPALKKAGYNIEPSVTDPTTSIVEIPVDIGIGIRTLSEVSMWEQLSLAAFMQKYWADNQVSCTVTFRQEEAEQIKHALNFFQYQLKGISFLPKFETGAYAQMPYEAISAETYATMSKKLKKLDFSTISGEEAETDKFCNNDSCELK